MYRFCALYLLLRRCAARMLAAACLSLQACEAYFTVLETLICYI